jgi:hypothetical protein
VLGNFFRAKANLFFGEDLFDDAAVISRPVPLMGHEKGEERRRLSVKWIPPIVVNVCKDHQPVTDAIPHLTGISNTIGTADTYSFAVTDGETLYPPFTGYTTTSFGTTTVLTSLTQANTFTTAFTYKPSGAGTTGELTQVTYPYGGSLSWG